MGLLTRGVAAAAIALGASVTADARAQPEPTGGDEVYEREETTAEMPEPAIVSDEAIATQLFDEGRALLERGSVELACTKLTESAQLAPRVGTLGKLAYCEERRGRLIAARSAWTAARALAKRTQDPRLPVVDGELARVQKSVPVLRVSLPAGAPDGVVVRVDGVALENHDESLAIDPGKHEVEVVAGGMVPYKSTIVARADGATSTVEVPPFAETAPPAPQPREAPIRSGGGRSPLEVAGLVTAGAGVVGLTVGAFYGGLAQGRLEEARSLGCDGDPCGRVAADQLADARASGDVATALVVAGSVLVAGGVTVWILAPGPDARTPSVGAAVAVDQEGAGVSLRGAF
jgi:hypothetical protein